MNEYATNIQSQLSIFATLCTFSPTSLNTTRKKNNNANRNYARNCCVFDVGILGILRSDIAVVTSED